MANDSPQHYSYKTVPTSTDSQRNGEAGRTAPLPDHVPCNGQPNNSHNNNSNNITSQKDTSELEDHSSSEKIPLTQMNGHGANGPRVNGGQHVQVTLDPNGIVLEDKNTPLLHSNGVHYQNGHTKSVTLLEGGEEEEEDKPYGWWGCRPAWLQWFNKPIFFLITTCLAIIGINMSVNGFMGMSITTLERRFGFSGTLVSAIPSLYEFSGIPSLIVVGLLGDKVNRPVWISTGVLLAGLGAVMFAMPHFLTGLYQYSSESYDNLCHIGSNMSSPCDKSDEVSEDSNYIYMFIASTILMGLGAKPLLVQAVTYLDDCLPRGKAALFVGILHGTTSFGAAIAFIGGSRILDLFTDIDQVSSDEIDMTPDDPRWVGAWWIGFLISGGLMLITVIPLYGFPIVMKSEGNHEDKTKEVYKSGNEEEDQMVSQAGFGTSWSELPVALKVLFKNPTYLLTTFSSVFDDALILGMVYFGPKYLENQFSLKASMAGIIIGSVSVPGAVGGTLAGSILVNKMQMSCSGCLRANVIMSMLMFATAGMFLMRCENAMFDGVNYGNTSLYDMASCSNSCGCNNIQFSPVCGSNGITYFSPCYAGCEGQVMEMGEKIYTNCSCVGDPTDLSSVAFESTCPAENCVWLPYFCILLFFAMFLIFAEEILQIQIVLRCVPLSQRSLALGVKQIFCLLMGVVPGAVLFGACLDHACILWSQTCDGEGSCLYFDNYHMAMYMMALSLILKCISAVFSFAGWKCYKSNATSIDEVEVNCDEKPTNGDVL